VSTDRVPIALSDEEADRLVGMLGDEALRDLQIEVHAVGRWCEYGDPAQCSGRCREIVADVVPVVAALLTQARADGAAEERERWSVLYDAFGRVVTKYTYAPGRGGNLERIAQLGADDMRDALVVWIRQQYLALDKAREECR
jgi:hypothetical protein